VANGKKGGSNLEALTNKEYDFNLTAFGQKQYDRAAGENYYQLREAPEGGTLKRAFKSGAAGLRSNINYLDAAFQAITGDKKELDEQMEEAIFWEQMASEHMEGLPTFAEFWDAPTVEGFIEQAKIAVGEFAPSIGASLAAAATGAVVAFLAGAPMVVGGAVVGGGTWAAARLGIQKVVGEQGKKALRKIMKESWDAKKLGLQKKEKAFNKIPKDSLSLLKKIAGQPGWQRRMRVGGLAGAYAQEYTQGTGVTFGTFARQDMTGAREAAISFGVGHPYAAVGVSAEIFAAKVVLDPLLNGVIKIAKKRALTAPMKEAKMYKALLSDLGKVGYNVGVGFTQGAVAEGGAETIQEAMTIAQRLSIDPEYDREQAKMDLLEASFKGIVGGGIFAGGGRGVTSSVERVVNRSRDLIAGKEEKKQRKRRSARGELEQLNFFNINPDFDSTLNNKEKYKKAKSAVKIITGLFGGEEKAKKIYGFSPLLNLDTLDLSFLDTKEFTEFDWAKGPNESIPEPIKDIRKQISSLFETSLAKDSVFLPPNQAAPTQKEVNKIFAGRKVHIAAVEGVGTLISLNKRKADDFVADPSKETIAAALKYLRPFTSADDRGFQLEYKEGGEIVHTELTNQADEEATKQSMEVLFKRGIEQGFVEIKGPYSVEDIAADTNERNNTKENKEDFNNVRTENAIDRIRNAKNSDEIGRVIESFWKDPIVLIELYKELTRGKVVSALEPLRERLEDRIKAILIPIRKELIATLERKGEPINDISLLDTKVLQRYKFLLQQQEEEEAKKTAKVSLEDEIEETVKAGEAAALEQLEARKEGEVVDETDEALGIFVREPGEFVEVLSSAGRGWLPLNEKAIKETPEEYKKYLDSRKQLRDLLSPEELARLGKLETQLGVKLPTGVITKLLELFEAHAGKAISYQVIPRLVTDPIVEDAEARAEAKNNIFFEEVVRQFKKDKRDRRRTEVKAAFVEEINKLKNTQGSFELESVVDNFPGIARGLGYAKDQLRFAIAYLPSEGMELITDLSGKREQIITEKEFVDKFFSKGQITGKEQEKNLAKLLDTALFTVLTPQARQNAEAKALKFREEWEGKLEEHLIGKFKEKKKDRRRKDVRVEFQERLAELEQAYDDKLQEFYREEEKVFHFPYAFSELRATISANRLFGEYAEGNLEWRKRSLLGMIGLGAKYGYDFRIRPSKPSDVDTIFISFKKTEKQVKSGKKTMTSRRSAQGKEGDVFEVDGALYKLTEEPKLKPVQDIIKEDFKKEGFDSRKAAFETFKDLGYITFDYKNDLAQEFMTGGPNGTSKYQRFVFELRQKGKTKKEIGAINREIREVHLKGLKKAFAWAKGVTILKNNSTIKVGPKINAMLKKKFGSNFSRLMVGNHGIYIEWKKKPTFKGLKRVAKREQYIEHKLGEAKFYEQTDTVNYADYKVGYWYANIHDATSATKQPPFEYTNPSFYTHEFKKLTKDEIKAQTEIDNVLPSIALTDVRHEDLIQSRAAVSTHYPQAWKFPDLYGMDLEEEAVESAKKDLRRDNRLLMRAIIEYEQQAGTRLAPASPTSAFPDFGDYIDTMLEVDKYFKDESEGLIEETQEGLEETKKPIKPTKVISGGQEGVDFIALKAAKKAGIEVGGTAPLGYKNKAENQVAHAKAIKDLGLEEHESDQYDKRTEQNVRDSDGTLIFTELDSDGQIISTPGTGKTIAYAREIGKPILINPKRQERVWVWLAVNNIKTVNIAGPREISKSREGVLTKLIENSWGKQSEKNAQEMVFDEEYAEFVELAPFGFWKPNNIYIRPSYEFIFSKEGILKGYERIKFALQEIALERDIPINSQDLEMDTLGSTGEADPTQFGALMEELEGLPTKRNETEYREMLRRTEQIQDSDSIVNSTKAFIPAFTIEELIEKRQVQEKFTKHRDTRVPGEQAVNKSRSFERQLGSFANPMLAVLKKFNYFGIKANLTFLTYDDINPNWKGPEQKQDKLLKLLDKNGTSKRALKKLWDERQKNNNADYGFRRVQRGATFKVQGDKEYIVVIDTNAIQKNEPFGFRPAEIERLNKTQKKLLAPAQTIIAIAHELGHVIALQELDNLHFKKGIKKRIWKDFKKAEPTNARYMKENGFEEWFADQTANWLVKIAVKESTYKAKNVVDGFFKQLAKQIKRAWDSLIEGVESVFAGEFTPSRAFNEFVNGLYTESYVNVSGFAGTFKFFTNFEYDRGHLNFEQKEQMFSMVEEIVEAERNNFGLPKAAWNVVRRLTAKKYNEVITSNPSAAAFLSKIVMPARSFLGRVKGTGEFEGEPVGRRMARRIQRRSREAVKEGEGLGMLDAKDQKHSQFINQLSKILDLDINRLLGKKFTEEHDLAFAYAENEKISDEKLKSLSPMGYKLRVWLRNTVYPYIQEVASDTFTVDFLETILRDKKGNKVGVASYFTRSLKIWDLAGDDALRNSFVDYVADKVREGRILQNTKDPKEVPTNEEGLVLWKDQKDPITGELSNVWLTPEEWGQAFVDSLLKRDVDESYAEVLEKQEEDIDNTSIKLGLPSSLARTMKYQVIQAVDQEGNKQVDENGEPVYKQYGFATSELRDIGLLEDGFTGIMNYIKHVTKRVEYERVGGSEYFEGEIAKMKPRDQVLARDAMRAMLGKVGSPMDPLARKINSWGLAANVLTTLTFAVFASFPDLAGPFLRSNSFGSFMEGAKEYRQYFTDKEQSVQFALDVGAIAQDSLSMMYIHASEQDYMTPGSKKLTDYFFKAIMLEQFTKFTRVFAAGMGKRFLVSTAHNVVSDRVTTDRWLKELNITRAEVLAWEKSGFDITTPEGKKASQAVYQFVNESIIRPNAAQRPVWASNPYFALVWQLKGFFYAYGQTIVGGQYREMSNRFREKGVSGAAIPLSMMALTILPLTLMGLELKEWTKWALAGPLPGVEMDDKYFRTDNMDWGTWFFELFDRSGLAGPFGLLFPLIPGQSFGGPYETGMDILGPTFGKAADLYKHGPFDAGFWKEQVPVYYTLW